MRFVSQLQKPQKKAVAAQEGELSEELKALTCSALKQHCDNPVWNREGRKPREKAHSVSNNAHKTIPKTLKDYEWKIMNTGLVTVTLLCTGLNHTTPSFLMFYNAIFLIYLLVMIGIILRNLLIP